MVSVVRPRKSNFTRPIASTSSLSSCEMTLTAPSAEYSGQKSVSRPGAISTPPACMPTLRTRPSSLPPNSSSSLHLVLVLLALGEQRLHLARVLERDQLARLHRDQLRHLVAEVVAEIEHAAAVAHHGARRHGAEGGDLRHAVLAVLAPHVVDHPVAPVLAEVDVEVGHRHALRVEEALEQQVVLERVEVGDAERVGDQRARARAAPRPHRHAVRLSPS